MSEPIKDDLQVIMMRSRMTHDSGYCYLYPVTDLDQYQTVLLFENNKIIGSINNTHDIIRTQGKGFYSAWHESLFFSTSDNSDPRTNGRAYRIIALNLGRETLPQIINKYSFTLYNSDEYNESVRNLLTKGFNLNSSIVNDSRIFSILMEATRRHFNQPPSRCLQIGPGGSLAVEFLLCISGVKEAVAIDINPLLNFNMENFKQTIQEVLNLVSCYDGLFGLDKKHFILPDVIDTGNGKYKIGDNTVEYLYPANAESTGFADESFDLIFSFTTLEHVKKPDLLIKENMRLLRKGGAAFHIIDLKDHRYSEKPLHFLCQTDEEWQSDLEAYIKDGQEHNYLNRWRHSDYLNSFKSAGFEILGASPQTILSDDELTKLRVKLSAKYRDYTDEDLRQLVTAYLVRK